MKQDHVLKLISAANALGGQELALEVYDRLGNKDLPLEIQKEIAGLMAGKASLQEKVFDDEVRRFMLSITGTIDIKDAMAHLGARKKETRAAMYATIQAMEAEGLITRTSSRHGVYRLVDRAPHVMDLGAPVEPPVDLELALGLHRMVYLFPRNIVLVSGEKDAGKTAFSLNAAWLNRDRIHVTYFNSEMGLEELRNRLRKFPQEEYPWEEWSKIAWVEKAHNFEDLIDPDGFNIIDFLEVGAEAYTVTEDIRRVFDRLDRGLLLIVMQKRSYKDFAVGGEGTLEKARLAINLEHVGGTNLCRITVAKNWRTAERPRGQVCKYNVFSGGEMRTVGDWGYPPDQAEAPKKNTKGFQF